MDYTNTNSTLPSSCSSESELLIFNLFKTDPSSSSSAVAASSKSLISSLRSSSNSRSQTSSIKESSGVFDDSDRRERCVLIRDWAVNVVEGRKGMSGALKQTETLKWKFLRDNTYYNEDQCVKILNLILLTNNDVDGVGSVAGKPKKILPVLKKRMTLVDESDNDDVEIIEQEFFLYICQENYLQVIGMMLSDEKYAPILEQFDDRCWEGAILCCSNASTTKSVHFSSSKGQTLFNTHSERRNSAIKIKGIESLSLIIKLYPPCEKNRDAWTVCAEKAAKNGSIKTLKMLFKSDKCLKTPALTRLAASKGHWKTIEFLLEIPKGRSMKDTLELVSLYRFLYMLEQYDDEKWDIVNIVTDKWRIEAMDANDNSQFFWKWKIAFEIACSRCRAKLVDKLLLVRKTDEEKMKLRISLKMVMLSFQSLQTEFTDVLFQSLPNDFDKSETSPIDMLSTCFHNSSSKSDKLKLLLLAIFKLSITDIGVQLSLNSPPKSSTEEDAKQLVSSLINYIIFSREVDIYDPEITLAIQNIFTDGNIDLGRCLIDCGLEFDWMEPQSKLLRIKFDQEKLTPTPMNIREDEMSNKYMSIISSYGIPMSEMMTYEDFEMNVCCAGSEIGTNEYEENVKEEKRMRKNLIVDQEDNVWTAFLLGSLDNLKDSLEREGPQSWMEPAYSNPFAGSTDDIEDVGSESYPDPGNALFFALGGFKV